jgi:hypothetical protein
MPCAIEYIKDEPIMVVHFSGDKVETDTMQAVFEASADLIKKVDGHIWRINNYENVDIPPTMLIKMAQAAQLAGQQIPGSTSDPNGASGRSQLRQPGLSRVYGTAAVRRGKDADFRHG